MKKFIIERKIPGAGNLTPDELRQISETSITVAKGMNKPYHWIQSFVTDDRIYCIHIAENEDDIREHAKCGKFPVNRIEVIKTIIDPSTAGE